MEEKYSINIGRRRKREKGSENNSGCLYRLKRCGELVDVLWIGCLGVLSDAKCNYLLKILAVEYILLLQFCDKFDLGLRRIYVLCLTARHSK